MLEIGEDIFAAPSLEKGYDQGPPAEEPLPKQKILNGQTGLRRDIDLKSTMGFAPVNEMGVVYLFGGMAEKTGLHCVVDRTRSIRIVKPSAKWSRHRWQRVRI